MGSVVTRRQFLYASSGVALGAVAGCSADVPTPTTGPGPSPTSASPSTAAPSPTATATPTTDGDGDRLPEARGGRHDR